ncbi:hypothetical protein [Streptomyces sp. NPDC046909]|uniref:hypothetical protein n=1 Tax=Streptomyces sp. NPDC046909 TaxID=3155617 RepID=UPI0033F03F3B
MGLLDIATSLLRHGGGGFWEYMTERAKNRTAIELERQRNAATANVIPMLKPGVDFLETEEGGRTRVIRIAPIPHSGDSLNSSGPKEASLSGDGAPAGYSTPPPALSRSVGTSPLALPGHQRQGGYPASEQVK